MPKKIVVPLGRCLTRIAFENRGGDPAAAWNHPENQALARRGRTADMLMAGDTVTLPDVEPKTVQLATDKVHKITVRVPKKDLRLRILDHEGQPMANRAFTLTPKAGGAEVRGATDGNGLAVATLPISVEQAKVVIDGFEATLALSCLEPMPDTDEESFAGVIGRLQNLGYRVSADARTLRTAIALFQLDFALQATGELNQETEDALQEQHGS